MKIEILYSDVCNLYADLENIFYLQKVYNNIKIYETKINEKPKFLDEKIDLVYIGACSSFKTNLVIEKLFPYKKKIKEKIENNQMFLVTGSASEIFGKKIKINELTINALGIFDYISIRGERKNFLFLGEYENIKIVGNKSQNFYLYNIKYPFIKVIKGYGNIKEDINEGLKYKNFYMTSLLGPFLILNPLFCEKLFGKINDSKEAVDAYNYRVEKLLDPNVKIVMGEHG